MTSRQIIRTDIAASALAHLSVLMLVILFSEVHPFGSVTAETVAVDIVTPEEMAENKPEPLREPKAQPSDALDFSAKPEALKPEASKPETSKPEASKPTASNATPPAAQQAAVPPPQRSDPQPTATAPPQLPAASPTPAYVPPQPDLSIKYQVMLGLPPDLAPSLPQARSGDAFDGEASKVADLASNLVTEFRRNLRTCSKLPGSIAASDKVKIKLRVLMTPQGRLAAEPMLIEASASMQGPLLMQSAIEALKACQPYQMLPADRYGEWKVLDLSFTPLDFAS